MCGFCSYITRESLLKCITKGNWTKKSGHAAMDGILFREAVLGFHLFAQTGVSEGLMIQKMEEIGEGKHELGWQGE